MTAGTLTIRLGKCLRCGTLQGPDAQVCRDCLSTEFTDQEVPAIGTVIGMTVIRRPPAGIKADGAYGIVSLRLDAGPQLTGRLNSIDETCSPGDRVHATTARDGILQFERVKE